MPWRTFLSEEMADLLRALSHPHRIRIIHELRNGPMDVNGLQNILGISHARVSQYLSALKQHHIVKERRDGRHVFYSLKAEGIAQWLHDGMQFLGTSIQHQTAVEAALRQSTEIWGAPKPPQDSSKSSDNEELI
ncbi:metalloregulator ArsR/SmtB family transcription factor [Nostoc sp. NIES-2111]